MSVISAKKVQWTVFEGPITYEAQGLSMKRGKTFIQSGFHLRIMSKIIIHDRKVL